MLVSQHARKAKTNFHQGVVGSECIECGYLSARCLPSLVNAKVLEHIAKSAFEPIHCQILLNVKVIHIVQPIKLVAPGVDVNRLLGQPIVEFNETGLNFLHSDAEHSGVQAHSPIDSCGSVALNVELDGILSQ